MKRGFTLLELLVVIAIIGILSSVVFASLNGARSGAQEAAIKASVMEMRKLMEFEYLETGSYTNLERDWVKTTDFVGSQASCATNGYAGSYASNMVAICEKIVSAVEASGISSGNVLHTFDNGGLGNTPEIYTIMAKLPSGYFCASSSGANSESNGSPWGEPGCYANP